MKKTYLVNALRVDIQRDMWGYIESHDDNYCYNDEFDTDDLDEIVDKTNTLKEFVGEEPTATRESVIAEMEEMIAHLNTQRKPNEQVHVTSWIHG